jgi:Kef-type K+ transport system membrane component KefB
MKYMPIGIARVIVTLRCTVMARFNRTLFVILGVGLGLFLYPHLALAAADEGGQGHTLISSIGIGILAATVMAFLSHAARQPLLLAYIAAGVIIGPQSGFGFVPSEADVQVIAEIGLIIMLFMIGLEIDVKKLRESGLSLILSGALQFVLCVALGVGFFLLLGYTMGGGNYNLLYLAACCGISSTTIVVKLLYGKFELDTLAGRITLGILVFQDLWAIIILGVQPNLANPDALQILWSFAKGGMLVAVSLLISKFLLPPLFKSVAKLPEIVLVASLGWCFLMAGIANALGLSLEMGALVAGVVISSFPYNLDVIAKIVSIRDFFITLFFVALGMKIPNPLDNLSLVGIAAIASVFLIASRFLSVYPLLYLLRNGHRVSLLTSINLSQISEFALVIASIGFAAGHIDQSVLTIIIFIFVITSIVSTYMIQYSDNVQKALAKLLVAIGLRDVATMAEEPASEGHKEITLMGFFRVASSLMREIQRREDADGSAHESSRQNMIVVDFNPEVHAKLRAHGVKIVYGDIGHMETLHHAGVHNTKVAVSTIPDHILVGTSNLQVIRKIRSVCPHAKVIVTAESPELAMEMYNEGADYVFLPRILAAEHLIPIIELFLRGDEKRLEEIKREQMNQLQYGEEIVK